MRLVMAGATNVGMRRENNQDNICFDQELGIGLVADGIGGRNGGEVASSIAVNLLYNSMKEFKGQGDQVVSYMEDAIIAANQAILKYGAENKEVVGMGTTIECLYLQQDTLYLGHVGDSRTYLFYKDQLLQMTLDHNIGTFLERNWIETTPATSTAKKSALVRALGIAKCDTDIYKFKVPQNSILLTATDGLFDMVSDQGIFELMTSNLDRFADLPKILIDAANDHGGRDNITVLVTKVE